MAATVLRHNGELTTATDSNRALHFVRLYFDSVVSDLSIPNSATKFYSPTARFFNTNNVTYNGADNIKTWMQELFSPFRKISVKGMSFLVIDESTEGQEVYTVNAETMVGYFVKGEGDMWNEPITVPRLFVFEIRKAVTEDAEIALQFVDIKLYWDTALLTKEMVKRKSGGD
jgi:hypothetical protein